MEELRSHLDDDVDDVVDSAKRLFDWRVYVRKHPWACFGAALAAGYFAVPRRLELKSPDVETLLQLAGRNKLVVQANPSTQRREGLVNGAFRFVAQAALREALNFAGRQMGKRGSRND